MITKKRLKSGNVLFALALISALYLFSISSSVWAQYSYTPLLPPGWQRAFAWPINNNSVVVGFGDVATTAKGFIYDGANYTELLPAGWQEASATAINDNGVIVGSSNDETAGKGFIATPTSQQQIVTIINFFDISVSNGTLIGVGPTATSEEGKLAALENMLKQAESLIQSGSIAEACQQLADAYKKTDGNPNPPDFVTGSATAQLASQIQDLRTNLGCP